MVSPSRGWSNVKRFYDGLWTDALPARPVLARPVVGIIRLLIVAAIAFQDRMLNLHAMGLVYTTLLSVVPFLAVAFSVLKAFGAQYQLEAILTKMLAPIGPQAAELTQQVVEFVSHMNVGVLGAIGVAGLFYTVVSLIGKVEDALNDIWKVRGSRGLRRKFSDYLSVLLVGPVLILAAFAIIASLRSHWLVQRILEVTRLEAVTIFVAGHLAPFLLLATAFTLVYRFLPYTRVRLDAAIVGGIAAAVLWQLAGVGFAALVAGSASYSAIYSSFAVLILSLIWLQVAWLVVLIGGQVAYVHQHPASYAAARRRHGLRMREHIGLVALVEIVRRYLSDLPPYRLEQLAAIAGLPVTILEDLVDAFVARGILARATEPEGLVLARPPEHVLVVDILDVIWGPAPSDVRSDRSTNAVVDILRKRDEVLREALGGVTLRSLASPETPAPDTTVAQLAQYRRR